MQKKEYAVVQNAVELTKKLGKKGASGFVNAFLRKFVNAKIYLPKNQEEFLSVKYSYPLFAVKELIKDYGLDNAISIISAENVKNTLFFPKENGEEYLISQKANFTKTLFEKAFLVENFVRNKDYDLGVYTFQSIGSVAICDMISPCEKILDCCAAPGGKSINLSYKCKEVFSWDVHEHRVELINDYKNRMGRENVFASTHDSKVYESQFADYFDSVLCDAPCSGLGVVNDNPDIKLNRSIEDVLSLNKEQLSILNNVCKYVKKGGYLYYSTCSVLKRENVDIINKFLQLNDNFELVEVDSPLSHLKIDKTISFLPNISSGAGFYFAKLKRVK